MLVAVGDDDAVPELVPVVLVVGRGESIVPVGLALGIREGVGETVAAGLLEGDPLLVGLCEGPLEDEEEGVGVLLLEGDREGRTVGRAAALSDAPRPVMGGTAVRTKRRQLPLVIIVGEHVSGIGP